MQRFSSMLVVVYLSFVMVSVSEARKGVYFNRFSTGFPGYLDNGWIWNPNGDLWESFVGFPNGDGGSQLACDGVTRVLAKTLPLPAGTNLYVVNSQFNFWADAANHTYLEIWAQRKRGSTYATIDSATLDHLPLSYPVSRAAVVHKFKVLGNGQGSVVNVIAGDSIEVQARCTIVGTRLAAPSQCYDSAGVEHPCAAFLWMYGSSGTNPASMTYDITEPGGPIQYGPINEPCVTQGSHTYNWNVSRLAFARLQTILRVPSGLSDQMYLIVTAADGQHLTIVSPEDYALAGGVLNYTNNFLPDILQLSSSALTLRAGSFTCLSGTPWRWRQILR
jgi:hypothetical protein